MEAVTQLNCGANIAFYLKDYTFACFKPLLALFDKNYQDTKALYKGLGYIFIADIILVPVFWKISSLLDYNAINENLLRSSDGQNKVQVMTATASTVFAWDNNIIFIICYVLIYSILSPYFKELHPFFYGLFVFIFFPVYLFDVFFSFILYETYFDEKHKEKFYSLLKKVFYTKERNDRFVNAIVGIAFSDGKIVIITVLSYIYISLMLYPLINYTALHDIYVRDILRGSLILFIAGCLLITWFSIVDVIGYIFNTPEQFYNWPHEIVELYNSNKKLQEEFQNLKNDYETIKQDDKDWIALIVHVLKTRSAIFSEYIRNYNGKDCIPSAELRPKVEEFGSILGKCLQIEDAIFDREVVSDETTPATYLRFYKETSGYVPKMLKPFVLDERISLNMHGLENEIIEIDDYKFKTILEHLFENATQYALDDTVISIDFTKENDTYILTISNIINPAKEQEILAHINKIDEFWNTRSFPSPDDNKVCLGLILAKINAQHMKADLVYKLENHLRFVVKLILKTSDYNT